MDSGQTVSLETLAAMVRAGTVKRELLSSELQARLERFEAGEIEDEQDGDQPSLFED